MALHGRRALSGLCRSRACDRGFAPARRGTGDGGRWRYRALDCGRHVQRQRRCAARQCAGQAHSLGPENQSGHHHQPPDVPAGADLDRACMDGFGVLGLSEDRMLALQRQAQAASAAAPVDTGLSLEKIRSATRCWAATRRGSRCAPSMTARRSISSSRPVSRKASCRLCCHRRAGRRATGELPIPLAVLHRRSAVRRSRTAPGR